MSNKLLDINLKNVYFEVSPEGCSGQNPAEFSAKVKPDQFLGGGGAPENSQRETSNNSKSLVRKFVEVNGIKTSYIERGNSNGIPIMYVGGHMSSASGETVFLDALEGRISNSKGLRVLSEQKPESGEGVKRMVESLKGKYRIVDLELPGFGQSFPLNGKPTLDRMADFTYDFQKAIGLGKSVIFGSSMGGIVAVKLAARHPEAVKALFLQGLMTQSSDMEKKAYIAVKIATSWPLREVFRIHGVRSKVFEFFSKTSKDFKMSEKPAQDAMIEGVRLAHTKTAISTLREIGKDIGEDIAQVQCPVVIIDGASGDMVPILKSARVAKRFHPIIEDPSERIRQGKVLFLPIGGYAGEHSHTIVNTFPEGTAAMIDDVLGKI